jgi:hypothetical protein
MWTIALLGLLLGGLIGSDTETLTAQTAAEGPATLAAPRLPRVRANGIPSLAALLADGAAASAKFRRLVATIDASDGIVYIEPGTCRHGVRACLMLTVQVAGPHRILRIAVDTHRDRRELVAAIGHELQHAVEVLSDRHVIDYHTMYSFFEHIGPTGSERFETPAAVRVGMEVMAELRTTMH